MILIVQPVIRVTLVRNDKLYGTEKALSTQKTLKIYVHYKLLKCILWHSMHDKDPMHEQTL